MPMPTMHPGYAAVPPTWLPWYGVGFGGAIKRFWRKAFIFHGRASRSEYWWACLFEVLVVAAVASIAMGLDNAIGVTGTDDGPFYSVLTLAAGLILFVPNLSVGIRRLHDENLRGWWILVPVLLTILAFAVVLVAVIAGNGSPQSEAFGLLGFLALYALSDIAAVVLMVLPSRPSGARFDRLPQGVIGGDTAEHTGGTGYATNVGGIVGPSAR